MNVTTTGMFELLFLPSLAACAVAIVSGPLGSFVVWRRMAYFGDTLAHSALMGVAIALVLDVNTWLGIVFSSLLVACLLATMQQRTVSPDSLLGILSHSSLAFALVLINLSQSSTVDLYGFLFGDLLTVTSQEVFFIVLLSLVTLALVAGFWKSLLLICIGEELAQAEGKNVAGLRLLIMCLIALLIAVAMKITGVLLITAMLIIPAATSRQMSTSPEAMATLAAVIGLLSVFLGLAFSATVDAPVGPSIVLSSGVFFLISRLISVFAKYAHANGNGQSS